MTAIVPPRPMRTQRKVLRRVNAHRYALACVIFTVLAVAALFVRVQVDASLSARLLLVGFCAGGLALLAAIGAVVFRLVEAPREIIVHGPDWPDEPPVIHLHRKD